MKTAMTIIEQLKARGVFATRLTADSRRVQPGDVFIAFPGAQVDGRDFIAQALEKGAAAVLALRRLDDQRIAAFSRRSCARRQRQSSSTQNRTA